jgi:hypothetical protein
MNMRALLLSSLIAGVGIALLSAIPIVSLVNCVLCGWVWGGGIGATYLYRRLGGVAPVSVGTDVAVGVLAGVIAAVIATVIDLVLGSSSAALAAAMQSIPANSLPPALANPAALTGFSLVLRLISFILFGLVGGFLGSLIFKSKAPTTQY